MPLYQYHAVDSVGKKRSGMIEALNEQEAKSMLRGQGVMVTHLKVKGKAAAREHLRGDQLQTFTIQLSQLVNAGVPLYESLQALEEQYRQEKFHRIILSLCERLKAGSTLSDAMNAFPESFDKLYVAMIRAGESVGVVGVVLEKLSTFLKAQGALKQQIVTALIYPSVLAGFSLLIIALLIGFVLPSLEGIFADRDVNTFTKMVLGVSQFLRNWWWLYIPALAGAIGYLVHFVRSKEGREWIERNFLKIPFIRQLMIQAAVARFCRTMGTLQEGGLPMIDSLRIAREVMGNVVLEEEVAKAEAKIIEGSSLSAELSRSQYFPHMVSRMLTVGEESGTLKVMLNKVAEIYEGELEKTLSRLVALAQPVILIVMGGVIGFILLAVLLPLTNVSTFALT